ncbi:Nuclear aminoacylation-dependent tRNA export pathway component [Podospora pseudocomata]|uniref:Nuclear aminoacylation-dependent tRNA export pathway component n=1 Tax=Podospora pseudocomata TaxID=2093779 RepID=A0ABR0GNR1_9PEZI|nr:Nuclear aminoacylation-dependent tRNA export pathway component [Podospora pseudocomata]
MTQRTVKFINDEASSVHGNLKVASVYTTESGEWKLGGFEVLSNVKDDEAVIYTYGSLVPDSGRYTPPELAKSGWDAIKRSPHSAVDAYDFGALIFEIFNGSFSSDQAGQTKNIPPSLHPSYKRLASPNPKARLTVAHFLEQGRRNGSFFDTPLIKLTEGVENLGVKTEEEREAFLDDLDQLTDDFPEDFFKMKVLPELLKSVEFGGGGPKAFGLVMKIATKLSNEDFDAKVLPVLLRLFGNPDRAIRVTGFTDVAPVVREQTLKSVLTIITKLSDRTINGELLKYLAKTANDEQPGIRTNTTICLGKIAKYLGTSSRSKVLIAAFSRSLRDPFIHARNAALMALSVTSEHFSDEDCATRVLPAICPSLIDKEKLIRDQAVKTLDVYVQRIKKAVESMPETALAPESAISGNPRMDTPQAEAAAGWAGWAISSFTNKLSAAAGDITSSNGASSVPASSSAPPSRPSTAAPITSNSSASPLHRQAVKSPPPSAPLTRNPSTTGELFFPEDDNNDDGADFDAWGDMGDMDDDDTSTPNKMTASISSNQSNDNPFAEPSSSKKKSAVTTTASSKPFDDGSEPDFAGWLAQQAEKKKGAVLGGSKALPKGLGKTTTATTAKKTTVPVKSKPVVVKKIDTKPKDDDGDDGWGGW